MQMCKNVAYACSVRSDIVLYGLVNHAGTHHLH